MKNINDLLTPCLILDEDKLSKNIKRIKSLCAKKKYNFRPHLKTAKCREITLEFAKNFGSRAMVSTIEEIENLKNCGINDFLYSVSIVPSKFERLAKCLSEDCEITVLIDSVYIAEKLVKFFNQTGLKIKAIIELDLDGHRSGIPPNSYQKIYKIAKLLDDANLFRGVMSHAGESYNMTNKTSLLKCAANEVNQTLIAVSFLKSNSIDCELISIGSTPTMLSDYYDERINELRAGVFVFFDLVQAGVGICELQDIALSVLTSVISINEESNSIIIDAGWTALSRDAGNSNHKIDYGYGQVCNMLGEVIEDLIVSNLQQEHGVLRMSKNSNAKLPDLKPGDLLRILPNHACATAAAHNKYHVINKEYKIDKIWNRFNYW
jgi:D-serine deaminase-like pyridoxal phosphate-dependent protein